MNNTNKPPMPKRVVRFDNLQLNQTHFTDEGYLIDHPIVTTVGIFEYTNPDGTVRRELRLPEEVFSEKSLHSYKGKPIIITHKAEIVDKDNVNDEHIGTILSKGYKDGDSVRAEIVIHETDKMKGSGLRELSLGYNLSLDETPGEWNGKPYDAIQRNIEINHLALVASARAGDSARLNIDGQKTSSKLKGGTKMKKRLDSESMTPEAFAEAIEAYKARKAKRQELKPTEDADNNPETALPQVNPEKEEATDRVQMVKDRRDRRDSESDPEDTDSAMGIIAQQDEDIDTLLKVIEEMMAKNDFDEADEPVKKPIVEENEDESEDNSKNLNMDAIDGIVSKKLELCRIGDMLRLDGIENMTILDAKKAIIKKVKPSIRLDGKSNTYINAMFDIAKDTLAEEKNTDSQRKQMFNKDSRSSAPSAMTSAEKARARMIEKQNGGNK